MNIMWSGCLLNVSAIWILLSGSATFIGYSTQGKNELTIQSWSLAASDVGLIDGHGYLSVSNVTCVPLGVSLMGRQKSEQGPGKISNNNCQGSQQ